MYILCAARARHGMMATTPFLKLPFEPTDHPEK
jgi:hypothetical protein